MVSKKFIGWSWQVTAVWLHWCRYTTVYKHAPRALPKCSVVSVECTFYPGILSILSAANACVHLFAFLVCSHHCFKGSCTLQVCSLCPSATPDDCHGKGLPSAATHAATHMCGNVFFTSSFCSLLSEVSYFLIYFNLFLPNKSYSGQAHTNHAAQISDYYMQPTTWGWRQQISKCTSRQRTTRKLKYKLLRPCDVMWNWPNELIWHLTGSWRGNVVLPKNWHKLPGRKLSVF